LTLLFGKSGPFLTPHILNLFLSSMWTGDAKSINAGQPTGYGPGSGAGHKNEPDLHLRGGPTRSALCGQKCWAGQNRPNSLYIPSLNLNFIVLLAFLNYAMKNRRKYILWHFSFYVPSIDLLLFAWFLEHWCSTGVLEVIEFLCKILL